MHYPTVNGVRINPHNMVDFSFQINKLCGFDSILMHAYFIGECRHEDTESSESSNSEAGGDHADVANGDDMPPP